MYDEITWFQGLKNNSVHLLNKLPNIRIFSSNIIEDNFKICFSLLLSIGLKNIRKVSKVQKSKVFNHLHFSSQLLWVEVQRPKRQSTTKRPRRQTWRNTWSSQVRLVCIDYVSTNPKWNLHRANHLQKFKIEFRQAKWCFILFLWFFEFFSFSNLEGKDVQLYKSFIKLCKTYKM